MSDSEKAYKEIVDYIARASTSELIQYRPSSKANRRVRELLAKNKAGTLTTVEAAELELFGELERFMQLVKARSPQCVESY